MSEHVITNARAGDSIQLNRYLSTPVTVVRKSVTADGVVLTVTSSGGKKYALLAVDDDDDRLRLEKPMGDDWQPFLRVDATLLKQQSTNTGP
jgi:hypothetical protein